jgi:hypothetical protein
MHFSFPHTAATDRGHPHTISVKLRDMNQLFNSMDPSPFIEKDLDDDAEEFIVSWAQEFSPNAPLKLRIYLEFAKGFATYDILPGLYIGLKTGLTILDLHGNPITSQLNLDEIFTAFRKDAKHPKRTPFVAARNSALAEQVIRLLNKSDFKKQAYGLLGVVKGYKFDTAKAVINGAQVDTQILVNSGILVAYSIDHAMKAIEESQKQSRPALGSGGKK